MPSSLPRGFAPRRGLGCRTRDHRHHLRCSRSDGAAEPEENWSRLSSSATWASCLGIFAFQQHFHAGRGLPMLAPVSDGARSSFLWACLYDRAAYFCKSTSMAACWPTPMPKLPRSSCLSHSHRWDCLFSTGLSANKPGPPRNLPAALGIWGFVGQRSA